jgi:UDP-glucose 4-epimerase
MESRGKRFVVIGGAGLIGSHTVDLLTKRDVAEIVIYDNFVRGSVENLAGALRDPRVKIFEAGGDITQPDILDAALRGADGVFHFAALWLLQCHEYPRSAFETNVRGTFNVLDGCVRRGVKRLVLSSSASVYGDAVAEPMEEDHPFNNKNFYGATKICGEAMARAYHHRYGLDYVGLRYMNVYGPRQDYRGAYIAVIMKMLDAIDSGQGPTVFGDGSEAFDFVAVEDCANANICALVRSCKQRWSERSCGRASVLSISAAVLVRARSRSPSAPDLPGRCWALTFQRRCWRALPSGCHRAPRSNSYAPTRRPTGSNRPLSIFFFRALASCFSRSRPALLPICARR